MKSRVFRVGSDGLREWAGVADCSDECLRGLGPCWFEVEEAGPQELRDFLMPLRLPAALLERCLDKVTDPGVVALGEAVMTEYPAPLGRATEERAFLTVLLRGQLLLTIRHGPIPALDELIGDLTAGDGPRVSRLSQIVYLILDQFADLNVRAQTVIRDEIQAAARAVTERPNSVNAENLSRLRWQVGNLIALVEDQRYCISGLKASDTGALHDPHRQSSLDDLMSETDIAQAGVYRLESRVNDLARDYQVASSERVEKRLRVLTIVSAITLPLGLVTGLLGMNVGGIPGTSVWFGFLVVVIIMLVIFLVEFWYFKRKGWFD